MSELPCTKMDLFLDGNNSEITQILIFLEGTYFLIIELYLPRQNMQEDAQSKKNRTTNK